MYPRNADLRAAHSEESVAAPLVFCAHLDTARKLAHPGGFLWELLMTRLYAGTPVLTDTMLLDTKALREAYQYAITSPIFEDMLKKHLVVCLHRSVGTSFREVLGTMVRNKLLFSGISDVERGKFEGTAETFKDVEPNEAAEKFWQECLTPDDKYHEYVAWLDSNYEKILMQNWPALENVQPFEGRVLQGIEEVSQIMRSGGVDASASCLQGIKERIRKSLEEEGRVSRSDMWRICGYHGGSPAEGVTFEQLRCLEIIDFEYLSSFPDEKNWKTFHGKNWGQVTE